MIVEVCDQTRGAPLLTTCKLASSAARPAACTVEEDQTAKLVFLSAGHSTCLLGRDRPDASLDALAVVGGGTLTAFAITTG